MEDAFIGLGSNQGAPVANLRTAVLAIDETSGIDVLYVSHVYESEPWGVADQPPFANAVAHVRTTLRADQLLGFLKDIEERLGRRPGRRDGPRVIDLDLLLFGEEEWVTSDLTIPHPRMAERDFVLTPLLAVAPHVRWPDGRPVRKGSDLVGRVVADHGRLPDVDPDWYVWEARDASAAAPVCGPGADGDAVPPQDPADAWIAVARGSAMGGQIDILESKLRAAGISYELSHREFGDNIGSLAGPARILVPASHAEEARMVLGAGVTFPIPREPGPPPQRPAWFRAALKVFGWMFAIYWIVRFTSTWD